MSRRKDQQRFDSMRRLNPDYKGFRGYQSEADRPGQTPLVQATCTACGRKRNVALGVAVEEAGTFVCQSCSREGTG